MKLLALTQLIMKLNHLIDTGNYDNIGIDEVCDNIVNGRILQFLKDRAGDDIDLSTYIDSNTWGDFKERYIEYLQNMYNTYSGQRGIKWGVENRGLCLLIAWSNKMIEDGEGYNSPNI